MSKDRVTFDRREVVIVAPTTIPGNRAERADLHKRLDWALDVLLDHDEGPGIDLTKKVQSA